MSLLQEAGTHSKYCLEFIKAERKAEQDGPRTSNCNVVGLSTSHVLGVRAYISLDCGFGSYLPYLQFHGAFQGFHPLQVSQQVTVGDGHRLEAAGTGVVKLKLKL